MYTLSTLLQRLPNVAQARLINSGYGLWMVWSGSFNNAVGHTLRDHGLVQLVEDPCQSFWVSFTPEVFRAVAKLQVWSRLNPLPLFCQVMPITCVVGYDLNLSASISRDIVRQEAGVSDDLEALMHPKLMDVVKSIPGLSLGPLVNMQGLSGIGWMPLEADQGLEYESPTSWYGVIRPLGRLGERESIAGWRAFFVEVQGVFQRLGIRYLADDAVGFVLYALDNYRQLRMFCVEISTLLNELKSSQRAYWPCVYAIMEQKGMSFSMDLPNRFSLDWNRLTPDFLHMHYRDGFSLSDSFKVNEISYGGDQENFDSWCNVSFRAEEGQGAQASIEVPLPRRWLAGTAKECFYCGLKNHAPAQCPSRSMPPFRTDVWRALGLVNLDDMVKASRSLDEPTDAVKFAQQVGAFITGKDSVEAVLVRGMFSTNTPCQLGLLPLLPRIKNREWPVEPEQLGPDEPWIFRDVYNTLVAGDLEKAKENVRFVSAKQGRSFESACLEGFVSLETLDPHMAQFYWQEAARIGSSTVQQGYILFLQGRLREVEGDYKDALSLFRQVRMGSPRWLEPAYREGVCMVKMGFTGQALEIFGELVLREPQLFNRILLDTEIDRGRVHVLSGLRGPWRDAQAKAEEVGKRVETLLNELPQWFDEDHDFRKPGLEHLGRMHSLAETDNYVAFREVGRGMDGFFQEMQKQIDEEIKRIKDRVLLYAERLREVQYEAGWFPFPKLLRDFNRDFNFCVKRINWVMTQPLRLALNFRKARRTLPELEERLLGLSKRLVTLRIVRDSTLFAMLLGKNFIWMEVVGLALALLTIPVLLFYSAKVASNWLVDGILAQKWAFQKGLIFLVTVFSLGLASLRSVMTFEKKKKELFEADAERRAAHKKPAPKGAAKTAPAVKPEAKPAVKPGAKPAAKPGAKAPARGAGRK